MQTYDDLAYVTHGRSRQKLDLFIPDVGKKWPLIIWVHGAAFAREAKKITFHLSMLSAVLLWPVSIIDSVNVEQSNEERK